MASYLLLLHRRVTVHPLHLAVHVWLGLAISWDSSWLNLSRVHSWLAIILLRVKVMPESIIWWRHSMWLGLMGGLLLR